MSCFASSGGTQLPHRRWASLASRVGNRNESGKVWILACSRVQATQYEDTLLQGHARLVDIKVPSHLPSTLEIHRVTPRLAQTLVVVGYLQTSPVGAELELMVGTATQLVCAIHSRTPEEP